MASRAPGHAGARATHARAGARTVESEERKFQDELSHGFSWKRGNPYRDIAAEAAIVRETDEDGYRQSREVRRRWTGASATSRWDELIELRKEIHRVGQVRRSRSCS